MNETAASSVSSGYGESIKSSQVSTLPQSNSQLATAPLKSIGRGYRLDCGASSIVSDATSVSALGRGNAGKYLATLEPYSPPSILRKCVALSLLFTCSQKQNT